ncbi:MAG: hypothetical protein RSD96_02640 [Bacilli bacterium]
MIMEGRKTMYILDEIKNKAKEISAEKIFIFVDMDGVIADYRFGERINIKNNVPGTYFNKRPITTAIQRLLEISKDNNVELFILSSCLYNEQAIEKDKWLDIHAPFFKKENRIYTISINSENRKQLKVDRIQEKLNENSSAFSVLIDDTHEILFLAQNELGKRFAPFHVITLFD